jgi:hypothetical protein
MYDTDLIALTPDAVWNRVQRPLYIIQMCMLCRVCRLGLTPIQDALLLPYDPAIAAYQRTEYVTSKVYI